MYALTHYSQLSFLPSSPLHLSAEDGDQADQLQEVEVDILDENYCGSLDPGMLCAGVLAGGKDSCGVGITYRIMITASNI